MPQFNYKARDEKGTLHESSVTAESVEAAKLALAEKGLWILEMQKARGEKAGKGLLDIELDGLFADFATVGLKDLVVFCRQFSTLVNSGVAMVRALTILATQSENPKLAKMLDDIKKSVEQGANLSEAFAKYPKVFDKLFLSMVKAGETGGVLDEVLNRIAKSMEDRERLNNKIKSAMAYPTVVTVLAIIIFFVMLTVILPQFSKIFARLGSELPAYTQFLMGVSKVLIKGSSFPWNIVVLTGIGSTYFGSKKLYSIPEVKYYIDALLLKLPVVGDLLRKVAVARFTRTFGTLIKSGVPILTSLEIVEEASGNEVISRVVGKVRDEVKQGGTISDPLEQYKVFPTMVVSMISVGEETGELDLMLGKIADFYDEEVETAVDALTSLLEPIMMVFLGGIVGAVIVGMYLPMFKIFESIN